MKPFFAPLGEAHTTPDILRWKDDRTIVTLYYRSGVVNWDLDGVVSDRVKFFESDTYLSASTLSHDCRSVAAWQQIPSDWRNKLLEGRLLINGGGAPPETVRASASQYLTDGLAPGSMDFSPDGAFILSAGSRYVDPSWDNYVTLWNAATMQEIYTRIIDPYGADTHHIRIRFSPDGTRFVTIHEDCLRLWDTASGDPIRTFPNQSGPRYPSRHAVFSPDGRFIAVDMDHDIRIFNADTGEMREILGAETAGQDYWITSHIHTQ
ncbi:hypothetical protein FACS189491_04830 [Spirochaetia bacterium]|nr:hypothetical protein FACS189491_04830 [Spirochaetia bacterium]